MKAGSQGKTQNQTKVETNETKIKRDNSEKFNFTEGFKNKEKTEE
jgi:hypothetical protein